MTRPFTHDSETYTANCLACFADCQLECLAYLEKRYKQAKDYRGAEVIAEMRLMLEPLTKIKE